jgi:hypothetical protein
MWYLIALAVQSKKSITNTAKLSTGVTDTNIASLDALSGSYSHKGRSYSPHDRGIRLSPYLI